MLLESNSLLVQMRSLSSNPLGNWLYTMHVFKYVIKVLLYNEIIYKINKLSLINSQLFL